MFSASFITPYNNIDHVENLENQDFLSANDVAAQIEECYRSPEDITKLRQSIHTLSNETQQHMYKLKDEMELLPQIIQKCSVSKKEQYVNVQHNSEELRNEICTIQESLRNVIDEESSLQKKNNMRITVEDLRSQAIHTYGATVDLTQKNSRILNELNSG